MAKKEDLSQWNVAKLRNWQEDVINEVEQHEEKRNSEQYQGVAEYVTNKSLSVTVAMPKGAGHTFLANYIAGRYPTLLIYGRSDHYKTVTSRFVLHVNTQIISFFEIYYSMYKDSTHHPTPEIVEVRKLFEGKKVFVVDNAQSVGNDVKDFIFNSSQG